MEPASQEGLLTSHSKPSGLADIKKFTHAFYDYLRHTELLHNATCKYSDQSTNITPVAEPGSVLQSPYYAICKTFEESSPCLHESIRELCLYIFPILTKGLKEDQLSLTEDETHDLANALEALMFIAVYVKTATKLYTCENHQDKIMGNLDWPAPLIRKLIPYLVQNMDSTARIDIVLLRTLEIIVNPPPAFGSSKLWLTIMREIEEDFILEDSQQSKFLSLLFVMLSTEARVRLCGIYQEQLQQLLDADTLPTLSVETLTLIYYMSSNSKTQQALIKNGVHTVLIEWMVECFMSKKDLSQDNGREKVDIVSKIFINLAQGLGKTALEEVISFIQNRAVAFYKIYEKNDIFDEIMGPIVSNFPFSSLVPVAFNIGNHTVGNDGLKFNSVDAPLFEDHKISVLNAKQSQELKNLIQRDHFKLEPFKKFDIEWTQVAIVGKDWTEKIESAESVLMTFLYVFRGKIIKIGVCIGDGFTWKNGWIVSNTSKKNFLFTCLENWQSLSRAFSLKTLNMNALHHCEFEIKDLKAQEALLYSNSGWKISVSKAFIFRVAKENALDQDCQFSRDYASLWCGDSFINLHQSQNSDCLYGSNPIAANLRNSFQLLRPNNHIFFVPKDVTLKEFLQLALPKAENLLDTLMVYHEQHIITLDTKLVDLKPSTENQSLFQIQDLRIVCLDNSEQLDVFEIASPVKTYKNIISQYYSKVRTPILSHLLTEGEPLDILKKIAPGGGLSQDFQNAYKVILDKIVPHVPTLGAIMAKDLILVLYQILFVRFEEINMATRILQKTILKYSPNAQLKACNPKGLYKLFDAAIRDAFSDHERLAHKYRALLRELRDADLVQDNNLVGLLVSTFNKGETELQLKIELIHMKMSKPKQDSSQIEQLFTDGFDIIIPYCSDQVCNKNFTKLAQSVTTFMNIKGYPLALTQNGVFLETLSDLIMQFRKQNQGQNIEVFEVYVDSTIEEMLLKLIHFVFTTLLQILQANQDFSSWLNILPVLVRTLNIFNLLQDELKKIYERKNIVPSQVEKLVETVESVTTILKILAHEQALMTQGLDIARTFSLQYLTKMESARTAQTLAQVLSLLDSINDDGLFFQTLASILELLEAWSKNKVLVNVFDTKVRDPKNEESVKTVPFFEYCMTFSNSRKLEGANQIAQLVVAKSNELDKEELKANKKAVIVRVFALFKSIQENLNNREL